MKIPTPRWLKRLLEERAAGNAMQSIADCAAWSEELTQWANEQKPIRPVPEGMALQVMVLHTQQKPAMRLNEDRTTLNILLPYEDLKSPGKPNVLNQVRARSTITSLLSHLSEFLQPPLAPQPLEYTTPPSASPSPQDLDPAIKEIKLIEDNGSTIVTTFDGSPWIVQKLHPGKKLEFKTRAQREAEKNDPKDKEPQR